MYDAGAEVIEAGTGGIDKGIGTGMFAGIPPTKLDLVQFQDTTNIVTNFVDWDFTATGIWELTNSLYPTLQNLPVVTP